MDLDDDLRVSQEYIEWRKSREGFIGDLAANDEEAVRAGWQRDYFLGRGPGDVIADQHQTKMSLRPFQRRPRK